MLPNTDDLRVVGASDPCDIERSDSTKFVRFRSQAEPRFPRAGSQEHRPFRRMRPITLRRRLDLLPLPLAHAVRTPLRAAHEYSSPTSLSYVGRPNFFAVSSSGAPPRNADKLLEALVSKRSCCRCARAPCSCVCAEWSSSSCSPPMCSPTAVTRGHRP